MPTQLLTSYSQLSTHNLFALCQALDLCAMNLLSLSTLERCFDAITAQVFEPFFGTNPDEDFARLETSLWSHLHS